MHSRENTGVNSEHGNFDNHKAHRGEKYLQFLMLVDVAEQYVNSNKRRRERESDEP